MRNEGSENSFGERLFKVLYYLNCILSNFISPKETGFFENVILNNSVIQFGAKIKIIKTICNVLKIKFDFANLHKLNNLRNLFAHESSYVEFSNKGMLVKMDELTTSGSYNETTFTSKYEEFLKLFKEENKSIIQLNEELINQKSQFLAKKSPENQKT